MDKHKVIKEIIIPETEKMEFPGIKQIS